MIEVKFTIDFPPPVMDVLLRLSQSLEGIGLGGAVKLAQENAIVEPEKYAVHANRSAPTGDAPAKATGGRRGRPKTQAAVMQGPREDLKQVVVFEEDGWDRTATKTLCDWIMFCNSAEMAEELVEDPANRQVIGRLNQTQQLAIRAQLDNLRTHLAAQINAQPAPAAPVKAAPAVAEAVTVPDEITGDMMFEAARAALDNLTTADGSDAESRRLFALFTAHALGDGSTQVKLNTLKENWQRRVAYAGAKIFAASKPGDLCRTDTAKWAKGVREVYGKPVEAAAAADDTDGFL